MSSKNVETKIVDGQAKDEVSKFLVMMNGDDIETAEMEMCGNATTLINLALTGIIDLLVSSNALDMIDEIAEGFVAVANEVKKEEEAKNE